MRQLQEKYMKRRSGKAAALLTFLLAAVLSLSACGSVSDTAVSSVPETETVFETETVLETEAVFETETAFGTEKVLETEAVSEAEAVRETLSASLIGEIVTSGESEFSGEVPEYSGEPYTSVNENIPFFSRTALPAESFEYYSELDELGRCKAACANVGLDIMPVKEREEIGQIKPSGWHTVKYDNIDGNYLYNRCHLIGYQLSAENANEKNLITGTRYLNVSGMLPFENLVADYVKETGNHVLYRVTPIFENDELLARGVLMEGWSVEDNGDGICFNVFAYNVQPDIVIDYVNGESRQAEPVLTARSSVSPGGRAKEPEAAAEETVPAESAFEEPAGTDYILNTNTHKFHYPSCGSVKQMAEKNKQFYSGTRDDVIAMGYDPCKKCNP